MKQNMRCIACGRKRKPSHERKCKTDKKYSPDCKTYEEFDGKAYRTELKAQKKAKELEQEERVAKVKADKEAKIKEEADAKAKAEADAKIEAEKIEAENKAKAIAAEEAKIKAKADAKAEKIAQAEAKAKEAKAIEEAKKAEDAKIEVEVKRVAEEKLDAEKKIKEDAEAVLIPSDGTGVTFNVPEPEQVKESIIAACEHTSNLVEQAKKEESNVVSLNTSSPIETVNPIV